MIERATALSWRTTDRLLLLVAWAGLAVPAIALAAPPPAKDVAARLDSLIDAVYERQQVEPAALADEAAFLRRVSLDLIGRIPTVAEVRGFQDNRNPARREQVVSKLLHSPLSARHAARFWRRAWLPEADSPRFAGMAEDVEDWLCGQWQANAGCDRVVRALLNAGPSLPNDAPLDRPGEQIAPTAFLAANEFRPENLAAASARAFLGLNLDCAQCHDHPFARWKREEFWQLAAFFSSPGGEVGPLAIPRLKIADTASFAEPRFLDRGELRAPPSWDQATGRRLLAAWIATPENPYFARNIANRTWAALLGRGLVEPLDDLSPDNPPPHPEILEALSQALIDSDFDLRYLTEAIVLTKAYRLDSAPRGGVFETSHAAEAFCRVSPVRGLTADQLYDSLCTAAGLSEREMSSAQRRRQFADRFDVGQSPDQRSIPQALTLFNGELMTRLTDPEHSPLARSVAEAPFLNLSDKIETLFLATLGRSPSADEAAPLAAHVARQVHATRQATGGGMRRGLADVLWVLLNSSEFNTNH